MKIHDHFYLGSIGGRAGRSSEQGLAQRKKHERMEGPRVEKGKEGGRSLER
jgi:hypothetical protein